MKVSARVTKGYPLYHYEDDICVTSRYAMVTVNSWLEAQIEAGLIELEFPEELKSKGEKGERKGGKKPPKDSPVNPENPPLPDAPSVNLENPELPDENSETPAEAKQGRGKK